MRSNLEQYCQIINKITNYKKIKFLKKMNTKTNKEYENKISK